MKIFYTILLFIFTIVSYTNSQVVISKDQLSYAKRSTEHITNGDRAKKSLVGRAKKELNREIIPVTQKNIIAVSGDPHDYVSMGPYWWADPSKPDGLPYIRRDGDRNPEVGTLDRDKLADLINSVRILSLAYYFTGEDQYAFKAVDNLKIWFLNAETKMNPNLNYGQMIPGRNEGKGRGTGIIDTYEFIELVDCITILSSSVALSKSDHDALKNWFSEFVEWLTTSEVGLQEKNSANNHGTAYDIQVAAYALFAEKKDIAKEYAKNFAEERIFKQVEPDGKQPLELERTLALHYSIYNANHMLDMVATAKEVGIKLYEQTSSDGRSISKSLDYIVSFLGKEKSEFPYQQIKEWDKNQEKICWLMRKAWLVKKNKEYDKLFDQYCNTKPTDMNWLLLAK